MGESEEGWNSDGSRSLHQSEEEGGPAGLKTRMERDWEEVSDFATLVWKTDTRGKSFSQLAVSLVQFIGHCPGMLGELAGDVLFDAASTQGTGATEPGWRDVLPLPVPDEVCQTVNDILKSDDFKVKKKGLSGGAVKAAYRTLGVHCLLFCMITGLNAMWSGLRKGARTHKGRVRAQQAAAVDRLSEAARYMVDSLDGADKGGAPRTPEVDWSEKIKQARVSYHGEIVAKAEGLELDRIEASLPPVGFGGVVDILDLCQGDVKRDLADPASCVLPEDQLPLTWPRPKVQVKDEEWEKLARALVERGILKPTTEVLTIDGVEVTNGLFAVEKVGRDLPDGRTAQRLIMDLRATNAVLKIIGGDIRTLTGACSFSSVVLDDGNMISISGDDLVSSFYLFRMPDEWLPYLTFEKEISWKALGYDRAGSTKLAASVLPMGFSSSVGVMQHVHRNLALWDPDEGGGLAKELEVRKDQEWPLLEEDCPLWCLYLDDSTFLRKVDEKVGETLVGKSQAEQDRMRRAYQFWGIPYNNKKAIEEASSAERLGAFLDGKAGRIGVTAKRTLETISLGLWILAQGQVSRKALQVFTGKEVHCLQFRRPLLSTYDEVWRLIASPEDDPYLTSKACVEIMVGICLSPLRFTDWRARLDPYVMASDASERGGSFSMAKRLTLKGAAAALEAGQRKESDRSGIVVFDFFAGIGGFLRSLERIQLKWEHHVVIERDKYCRRCIRRTWPGGSEYTDISKMTKEDIIREISKVENPRLIVAGGGSPCQGLSKLSSERKHFEDERSKLFYDLADRLDDIEEVCKELGLDFLGMVENVQMDESDRDDVSLRLDWKPNLCQSGDISWVRRPRFYWISEELPDVPWLEVDRHEVANQVRMLGDPEPEALWLPENTKWEGQTQDSRFPTFTRPIRRKRPPPSPAGLKQSSQAARQRWEQDEFRYPPYVYEAKYLLTDTQDRLHKLPSYSREVLMGFKRDHTRKLDRELFEKHSFEEAEDIRCSALGNTFHTTTVAVLLGAILHQKGYISMAPDVGALHSMLVSEHMPDKYEPVRKAGDSDDGSSLAKSETFDAKELIEELLLSEAVQTDLDEGEIHKHLMSKLVLQFLRKVEFRGSDIRLDTGAIFRPGAITRCAIDPGKWRWKECRAFRWKRVEHIGILELKAALHSIQWRGRRGGFHSFRTMLLIDNQSVLAVIAKGRSSSRSINHLLRKLAALACSLNIYLLVGYVDTVDNPADKGSRKFDGDR